MIALQCHDRMLWKLFQMIVLNRTRQVLIDCQECLIFFNLIHTGIVKAGLITKFIIAQAIYIEQQKI